MNLPADDLETFDRLLGPELPALLDALDAVESDIDALPTDRDASAGDRRAELAGRRERLRADALGELVSVRHRLVHGAPSLRDDRTIPLPFVDLGVH